MMQKNRIPTVNRLDSCYDSRGSLDDITSQSHAQQRRIAMMNEEEHDRKIVNEFCHLLEKSKQLFNGLRDLPQYGHKQWQPYFGKTFDVYTKLWKFQQQNRQALDAKYGLKRWQIGEIASKIGQLYYHYYLRTSETNYLNEAFSFYSAIRTRGYYSKANKEERCDLMVKKLRYYARFIVVCLLLKKMKLVRDLVRELTKHIDDYSTVYEPDDHLEWSLVLSEIKAFIDSDNLVTVTDVDDVPVIISHRLNPLNTPPPIEKLSNIIPAAHSNLTLQEILIVGNVGEQVKFSELTLDMFRMLQALEREPQEEQRSVPGMYGRSFAGNSLGPSAGSTVIADAQRSLSRDNPHKYLLYKPTIHQLLVFLASGFKELPPNGILLLYLSADSEKKMFRQNLNMAGQMVGGPMQGQMPGDYYVPPGMVGYNNSNCPTGYEFGGVNCNARTSDTNVLLRTQVNNGMGLNNRLFDPTVLHPGDLHVFLRKPFFLIVDSSNAQAFSMLPRLFGQPLLVLMSPEEAPPPFQQQQSQYGNLFTLFLHCPLTALCLISNIIQVPLQIWDKAQREVDRFLAEAARALVRARQVDPVFIDFMADDFLRLLILRFIFCSVMIRMHRLFKDPLFAPLSHPPLSSPEIIDYPSLRRIMYDIADILDIRSHFVDIPEHPELS